MLGNPPLPKYNIDGKMGSHMYRNIKYLFVTSLLIFTGLLLLTPTSTLATTETVSLIRQNCTGYTNCYTSLSAWESAKQRDLVALNEIEVAKIEGIWTSPDTTGVTIDGWTTGPDNYIKIYTAPEARHGGKWDTGKYYLQNSSNPLIINEQYIKLDGLQINHTGTIYSGTRFLIHFNPGSANASSIEVSNSILKGTASTATGAQYGIMFESVATSAGVAKVWNNIIYDIVTSSASSMGISYNSMQWRSYIYNNTVINSYTCYEGFGANTVVKNNIAQNCTDGFNGTFESSSDYNISSLATDAPGSNSKNSTTVSFVDASGGDFHLSSSDTSAKDSGANLSSDSYVSFTTDIDGETRSGAWDIGADETSGGVPTDTSPPTIPINLSATAISSSQINLSWTASTDNTAVTGYKIYRNGAQINSSAVNSYPDAGLSASTIYIYTVSAYDAVGNNSTQSSSIQETTQSIADTTPPVRSSGSPAGALSVTTTSATLSLSTNENATCKYSTSANTVYSSMANTFSTTGSASHSETITGLISGTNYNYYVRCQDVSGNANTDDYVISFSVTSVTPPPTGNPSISSVTGTISNGNIITVSGSSFGAVRTADYWDTFDDYSGDWSKNVSTGAPNFPVTGTKWSGDGNWTESFFNGDVPYSTVINGKPLLHVDSSGANYSTGRGFTQTAEYYISDEGAHPNSGIGIQNTVSSNELYGVFYAKYDPLWQYPYTNLVSEKSMELFLSNGTKMVILGKDNDKNFNTFSPRNVRYFPVFETGGDSNSVDSPTIDGEFKTPGKWSEVKFYFKLNTPGQSDGIIKMWMDGKLFINDNTANLRGNNIITFGGSSGYGLIYFFGNIQSSTRQFTKPGVGGEWDRSVDDVWVWQTNQPQFDSQFPMIPVVYLSNQATWGTGPADRLNGDANFIRQRVGGTASADVGFKSWLDNQFKFEVDTVGLDTGQPIYLYAINWSGNVNSSGYQLSGVVVPPPVDTTAPVISGITPSVTTNSVTITFTTDESSDTQIEYGLTTSYGQSTNLNTTLVTSHSQIISNLTPNTTYNYHIITKDLFGNTAISQNYTFVTQSVPDTQGPSSITNLSISDIGQTSLALSWTTPSDTSGVSSYDIRYSTASIDDSNFSSSTQVSDIPVPATPGTTQTQYISVGLTPGTFYYFAIKSKDSLGNISSISNIAQAVTLSAPSTTSETPSITPGAVSIPVSSSGGGGGYVVYQISDTQPPSSPTETKISPTSGQISLSWSNPKDTDFVRIKILRKDNSAPTSPADGLVVYDGNQTTFTDTNLQNNLTYYYALYSYDRASNYAAPIQISAAPTSSATQTSIIKTIPATTKKYSFPQNLYLGVSDIVSVRDLQQILILEQVYPEAITTGIYGPLTKKAVTAFQKKHRLTPDGTVGTQTRTKLNSLYGGTPTIAPTTILTRNLTIGSRGTDVKTLQQILNADPDTRVTLSGAGSPGNETTYFGPATRAAVIKYQKKHGITPTRGYVGPLTRTKIGK